MVVVLCDGCWDGLHIGHILHLKAARAMGDWLVVAVTADAFVNKGTGRPVFPAAERAAHLRELACVGTTLIVTNDLEAIRQIRPSIYVKGKDYKDTVIAAAELCRELDVELRFTDTLKLSSTALLSCISRN